MVVFQPILELRRPGVSDTASRLCHLLTLLMPDLSRIETEARPDLCGLLLPRFIRLMVLSRHLTHLWVTPGLYDRREFRTTLDSHTGLSESSR